MPAPFNLTRFAVASTLAVSVLCLGYTVADAATPREVKRMVVKIAADTAVPPSMVLGSRQCRVRISRRLRERCGDSRCHATFDGDS